MIQIVLIIIFLIFNSINLTNIWIIAYGDDLCCAVTEDNQLCHTSALYLVFWTRFAYMLFEPLI